MSHFGITVSSVIMDWRAFIECLYRCISVSERFIPIIHADSAAPRIGWWFSWLAGERVAYATLSSKTKFLEY
jgi:hypothetical protein